MGRLQPAFNRIAFVTGENESEVTCRYVPGQDRILFCDGQAIGVRSDYNGVLLLDSILQKPVTSTKDEVKLELLLSEVYNVYLVTSLEETMRLFRFRRLY